MACSIIEATCSRFISALFSEDQNFMPEVIWCCWKELKIEIMIIHLVHCLRIHRSHAHYYHASAVPGITLQSIYQLSIKVFTRKLSDLRTSFSASLLDSYKCNSSNRKLFIRISHSSCSAIFAYDHRYGS